MSTAATGRSEEPHLRTSAENLDQWFALLLCMLVACMKDALILTSNV